MPKMVTLMKRYLKTRLNMLFIPTLPVMAGFTAMIRMLSNAVNACQCCALLTTAEHYLALLRNNELGSIAEYSELSIAIQWSKFEKFSGKISVPRAAACYSQAAKKGIPNLIAKLASLLLLKFLLFWEETL